MIQVIPVSFNILQEVKSLQVGLFVDENELQGRSADKSLESTTARVNNRRAYGLIGDVFDLAAAYAAAIAQGHCFRDANKRTAFQTMDVVLELNGINIDCSADEVGDNVIALAQSAITESDFAAWLRSI
jgi:death-on-curing protein|tara:strand:+ start:39 stop:425 length:387 start_codon:yes stop_codon:yes gene_type:complete